MAARSLKPYLATLLLMVLTSLALAFSVDVNITDQAGVKLQLPAKIGPWQGDEVRFCQSNNCSAQLFVSEMTNRDICTKCGGTNLHGLSKIEMDLLPADTGGVKERYMGLDGHQFMVSIVLSGKERASIHRPEVCLSGQGNDIVHHEVIDIPIAGRAPLKVKLLELTHERTGPDGRKSTYGTYYAYWFVGKGRETPEHWQRMVWMATDRIFHNVSHRWAYIAVAGIRDPKDPTYRPELSKFIAELYPAIALE